MLNNVANWSLDNGYIGLVEAVFRLESAHYTVEIDPEIHDRYRGDENRSVTKMLSD